MDYCRVSKHYSSFPPIEGEVNYVARLDGCKPVVVRYNDYVTKYGGLDVLNLFDIKDLYCQYVPEDEDWFVCYEAGLSFETDIRDRNIRKYTKGLVYQMLLRLCHNNVLAGFSRKDIIKHSWHGEVNSYFRPYYVVHVDYPNQRRPKYREY